MSVRGLGYAAITNKPMTSVAYNSRNVFFPITLHVHFGMGVRDGSSYVGVPADGAATTSNSVGYKNRERT